MCAYMTLNYVNVKEFHRIFIDHGYIRAHSDFYNPNIVVIVMLLSEDLPHCPAFSKKLVVFSFFSLTLILRVRKHFYYHWLINIHLC